MSKQQTAVDWLIEQIAVQPDPNVEYYTCNGKNITKEVLEAKALHRQQIVDAWCDGALPDKDNKIFAEQYYNEIFGK